ncbi:MAG: alpha-2-macroglobulin family protein [Planctomycetota bacterium]
MTDPKHEDNALASVDQYVHGLLRGADRRYVERRIDESEVWAAAHREALRRKDLLEGVPAHEPSEALIASTLGRVAVVGPRRDRRRKRFIVGSFASIAALVAVFLGVEAYFRLLAPSPYDLQIMGQRTLASGSAASIRVRLASVDPDRDVSGRDVWIELRDEERGHRVELARFATDAEGSGSPRFTMPEWPSGTYSLSVSARTPSGTESIVREVALERSARVILSTDKPVYQPGQNIRVRVYAIDRGSRRPLAGEAVKFELTDPKGNLIFRERTIASAFGIASTECRLAALLNEGDYTLRCTVGDSTSERAVRVERYTLPKFKVSTELDRAFYLPFDVVRGTVHAEYFFGEPVAQGGVSVEMHAEVAGESRRVGTAGVVLDGQGRADFSIPMPDRLIGTASDDGDARVEFRVRVEDAGGQSVERSIERIVTSRPLRIHAVAEGGTLVEGVPNTVYVFTTSADGSPVATSVSVEGFARTFWTGEDGIASFEIDSVSEGGVALAIRAVDREGRAARSTVTLDGDSNDGAFVLRTDATSYEAGSTMTLSAFGGGNGPVFVDLVRDGQTVLTDRMTVSGGKGTLAIDLPADLTGPMRLAAYRFDDRGRPVRRDRVIVVRPSGELNVQVIGAEGARRPGEGAELEFRVTTPEGEPAPGALSVSIVDEAVFGVHAAASPITGAMDALEAELLEPIYAVYPWDPFAPNQQTEDQRGAIGALAAVPFRSNRDTLMRELLDEGFIAEEMLDVLESERFDEVLGFLSDSISPEVLAVLRGESDLVFTLRETTYIDKLHEVERAKGDWRRIRSAILGFAAFVLGVSVFVLFVVLIAKLCGSTNVGQPVASTIISVVIIALLIGIMLPALGTARRSSRQLKDSTTIRGLAQGLEVSGLALDPRGEPTSAQSAVRVREWFPESLLWRPELITDDRGVASLDLTLADSITNWRVSASAITADGRLGGTNTDLTVFQPFFVDIDAPVALTRGDVVAMPVVVYNYLEEEQTVELAAERADWFELLDQPSKVMTLGPGEVRGEVYRVRAMELGTHALRVDASGVSRSGVVTRDALRRDIVVDAEGIRVERAFNGTLRSPESLDASFPTASVKGSHQVTLKLYPSAFSQVLEGLDGIFQRPYGCFEQTSSTTYPNILALDYMLRTGVDAPEAEARALQYIHLGYQRLLSFEVDGGGFDWFGNPPANRTLTAYGLMEFEDMARVRDVDPDLIARTRDWLLDEQNADGSWTPESYAMHDDPTASDENWARLLTTAYIAWAAFAHAGDSSAATAARRFLLRTPVAQLDDPYTIAMVSLALMSTGGRDAAGPYLGKLSALAEGDTADSVSWQRRPGNRTMFYGAGRYADVEATSLAVLALVESGHDPMLARAGLSWLVAQRDAWGTWGTTQATVLSLKALVAAADAPLDNGRARRVTIAQGGTVLHTVEVSPDQSDVMQLIDLSSTPGFVEGEPIELVDATGTATAYQLALSHHELAPEPSVSSGLDIAVSYDRAALRVGEVLHAAALTRNTGASALPMVMLDLPVPPGFEPLTADFTEMVERGTIARFETNARSVVVYLTALNSASELELKYRLRATMPVEVQTGAPRAYEYYDPDVQAIDEPVRLRVTAS